MIAGIRDYINSSVIAGIHDCKNSQCNCRKLSYSVKLLEEKIFCFDLIDLGRICLDRRRIVGRTILELLQQLQSQSCRSKLQGRSWGSKLKLEVGWCRIEPCLSNLSGWTF